MLLADPIAEAADGECSASREYGFVCGPRNPEDLAQIPGTKWIISSGMAAGAPIYLVDSQQKTWTELYPASADGHSTLYVVGHGGREAIEVFDVSAKSEMPASTWLGCVMTPDGMQANSVASLADGSLLATIPLRTGAPISDAPRGKVDRRGLPMVPWRQRLHDGSWH